MKRIKRIHGICSLLFLIMIIPSLCLAGDASSQAIEDQSLKHINQGVNYFNEGEYDAAEGEF